MLLAQPHKPAGGPAQRRAASEDTTVIYGIGIDSIGIDRVARSLQRPHFGERVFSAAEREMIGALPGKRAHETAAGCFAAKEALLKAAGLGLGGFALDDIAALRRETGAPYYHFAGKAARFMAENGLTAHLSITHDGGVATAFALLEKT